MAETRITGGCQCGAVRYAITAPLDRPSICHCRMCQKAFGAFYAPLVGTRKSEFHLTRGALAIFRSSDVVERGFCRDCGTPLTFNVVTADMIDVSIGSLDDPTIARPVVQFGMEGRIPWVGDGWDLPVWVAGYGPNALATAGRHADGYILQLADPQIVEWTVRAVREAAEAAGRDPSGIDICVVAPAYVGGDLSHQRDQLRWFGGMVGNHVVDMVNRYGEDSDKVPRVLTDYIKARESYNYDHHGKSGNPSTEFVPDDIVDRFCLVGPVEAHIEKLTLLESLGVGQFGIYLMHDDMEGTLEAYGDEVIPRFG